MTEKPLPIRKFSQRRAKDLPFEIVPMEAMPTLAFAPEPHRHTFYEIFWVTAGTGRHFIDFEGHPIQPHTLFFITPGQVHYWDIEQAVSGYGILFTDDFLPSSGHDPILLRGLDFFHRMDHPPIMQLDADQAEPFDEFCLHMLAEYRGSDFGRFAMLQSLLHMFLIYAQRHYTSLGMVIGNSAGQQLAEKFVQLIDLHFRTLQTVQGYAELLGVTAGHLTDTAHAILGESASRLIRHRISLEAKRLLAYSSLTVAEIGTQLNFDDPAYFARFFKRETGHSPTAFREQFREKYQLSRS